MLRHQKINGLSFIQISYETGYLYEILTSFVEEVEPKNAHRIAAFFIPIYGVFLF